jgi:O-antigen ligase
MQKNPVGQMIANAILLLAALRPLRGLLPCLVVLVPGLLLTGSRGAMLALAIGLAVILAMHRFRTRLLFSRAVPLIALAAVAFAFLPLALQSRLTTFSPNRTTSAGYPLYLRDQYSQDAKRIIAAHPVTGVGIGNFGRADARSSVAVNDPHDVLLLQAAEGGYGLAVSFVLLILGSTMALFAIRHVELAPAAAAVLLATVAHGLFDVYWVRGTPLLSWLLIGMAFGQLARAQTSES